MSKRKSVIQWTEITKKLSELKPFEDNPRDITEKGLKDLSASIDKFGQAEPIVINTDNTIIGGHARYYTLKEKGTAECKCYIPNRKLTKKEVKELNIRLNRNIAGEWDFDKLVNNFEVKDLIDWGFEEYELGAGDDFNPATEEEQGRLDKKETEPVTCPNCGEKFVP